MLEATSLSRGSTVLDHGFVIMPVEPFVSQGYYSTGGSL